MRRRKLARPPYAPPRRPNAVEKFFYFNGAKPSGFTRGQDIITLEACLGALHARLNVYPPDDNNSAEQGDNFC